MNNIFSGNYIVYMYIHYSFDLIILHFKKFIEFMYCIYVLYFNTWKYISWKMRCYIKIHDIEFNIVSWRGLRQSLRDFLKDSRITDGPKNSIESLFKVIAAYLSIPAGEQTEIILPLELICSIRILEICWVSLLNM